MKQNERKNMISIIQNNLKQMHQQAQQYLDKHHGSLPPICTARHYLFHTIDGKVQLDGSPRLNSSVSYKLSKQIKQKQKDEQKQAAYKPKKSVYNLEFKKLKLNQNGQNNHFKNSLMNSTSLRLKMMGSWRNSRYADNMSERYNQQNHSKDKMKTIVMNSQIVQLAEKDLKINSNSFSPKLNKLQLPKKQSEVLRKYLSRFKQSFLQDSLYQQQQEKPRFQKVIDKSKELIEVCIPKQVSKQLPQNTQNIRRRRSQRKTIDNPQNISKTIRPKQHKQILQIPKKKITLKNIQYDIAQGDCTPWNQDQKIQQFNNFDFS